tara:strand:+ start:709 stop:1197 length:489 start_codon:yes stop_codon:yes gene_type:complete
MYQSMMQLMAEKQKELEEARAQLVDERFDAAEKLKECNKEAQDMEKIAANLIEWQENQIVNAADDLHECKRRLEAAENVISSFALTRGDHQQPTANAALRRPKNPKFGRHAKIQPKIEQDNAGNHICLFHDATDMNGSVYKEVDDKTGRVDPLTTDCYTMGL